MLPDNSTKPTQQIKIIAYGKSLIIVDEAQDFVTTQAAKSYVTKKDEYSNRLVILYNFDTDEVHFRYKITISDRPIYRWVLLGNFEVVSNILGGIEKEIGKDNERRRIC